MQRIMMIFMVLLCCSLPMSAFAALDAQQIVISENGEAKVAPTNGTLHFSQSIVIAMKKKDGASLTQNEAKKMLLEDTQKLTSDVKSGLVFAKSFTKDFDANVSFSPMYDQNSKAREVVGYQAYANYSITVTDLKRAEEITTAILKSGIEKVSSLYPVVDETGRLDCEKRALRDAVLKAKERAGVMAELMGGTLGNITKAVINSNGMSRMMMAKGVAESTNADMYEQRDSTCQVRVEFVFAVQ